MAGHGRIGALEALRRDDLEHASGQQLRGLTLQQLADPRRPTLIDQHLRAIPSRVGGGPPVFNQPEMVAG